jgi:hypothetical protein
VRLAERKALIPTAPEFNSARGIGPGQWDKDTHWNRKGGWGDAVFVQLRMGFVSLISFNKSL